MSLACTVVLPQHAFVGKFLRRFPAIHEHGAVSACLEHPVERDVLAPAVSEFWRQAPEQ